MPPPIDGLLILDKPEGPTSHKACARVARALGAAKAGHGGTLDPAATGVLVLCLGRATKLFDALQQGTKEYVATVALGRTTDTLDATGTIVEERPVPRLDAGRIEAALAPLRGEILQVPPMYSARKRDGKPLHRLARAGIEVAREPRRVTIHRLERLEHDEASIRLRVVCSKGTYVRTIAADLGEALGCGGHLAALRRTASGQFRIEDAVSLDEVLADPTAARARVIPLEEARRRLGVAARHAGAREGTKMSCRSNEAMSNHDAESKMNERGDEPQRPRERQAVERRGQRPEGRRKEWSESEGASEEIPGGREAWVHVPGPSELGRAARDALERLEASPGDPPAAARSQSLHEASMLANLRFDRAVLDDPGETSVREREMIALVVSARNRCQADVARHRRRLAGALEGPDGARDRLLERLQQDWRRAPITNRERVMLAYADRLTRDCASMDRSLVEAMRGEGLSDTAITEVAMVAAYVAFENRVSLGLGVAPPDGRPSREMPPGGEAQA